MIAEPSGCSPPAEGPKAVVPETVLSLFDINPKRIDGTAMFVKALATELNQLGMRSVACFPSDPVPLVQNFLNTPGLSVEADPAVFGARYTKSVPAVCRLLRRHRPSVVHMHFMGLISPIPWLAKRFGVKRILFTDHASRPENVLVALQPALKRLLARLIIHPIDRVISVSRYTQSALLGLRSLPLSRLHVVLNGIDMGRVATSLVEARDLRLLLGIPPDRVLITQVCWLIPEKGVIDLIAAAKIVLRACPSAYFLVVGDGPDKDKCNRAVVAAGIQASFLFAGELSDVFMDGVFTASDIVCQPSRWQEAFCWVVAEAMAFGKPVVATRTGALPEVVSEGVSGFLVPVRDTDRLAASLVCLVTDAALRRRMGEAGAADVVQRLTLQRNICEHVSLYGLQGVHDRRIL